MTTDFIRLPNETKIKFGNAFNAMQQHLKDCEPCRDYMNYGDGDLCDKGKDMIARELCYAGTSIEFTP